jgi:hypothetical protein
MQTRTHRRIILFQIEREIACRTILISALYREEDGGTPRARELNAELRIWFCVV